MPRTRPDEGEEDLLPEIMDDEGEELEIDDDDEEGIDDQDRDDDDEDDPDDEGEDNEFADEDDEETSSRHSRRRDRDRQRSRAARRNGRRWEQLLADRRAADERAQKAERALAEQEARLRQWQSGGIEAEIQNLETIVKSARTEMQQSLEAGETTKYLDALDRYNTASFQLQDRRVRKSQLDQSTATHQKQQQNVQQQPGAQQQYDPLNLPDALLEWADRVNWGGLANTTQIAAAKIGQRMRTQEGWDVNDPDFIPEWERRLARALPRSFGKTKTRAKRAYDLQGERGGGRRRPADPAPRSDTNPNSRMRQGPRRDLNSGDRAAMKLAGLDPSVEKDRNLYLRANPTPAQPMRRRGR